ncbi:hypothetical protein RRG08_040310, partial [Elysia crispata]
PRALALYLSSQYMQGITSPWRGNPLMWCNTSCGWTATLCSSLQQRLVFPVTWSKSCDGSNTISPDDYAQPAKILLKTPGRLPVDPVE